MTTTVPSLGLHVQAFFGDYLTAQRALSQHTVLSYRDTFKLFLGFAARRRRKSVSDLGFADIGPDAVLAFLEDLERSRKIRSARETRGWPPCTRSSATSPAMSRGSSMSASG